MAQNNNGKFQNKANDLAENPGIRVTLLLALITLARCGIELQLLYLARHVKR